MTYYSFGTVLLAPYLSIEKDVLKKRPLIVISRQQYKQRYKNLIAIAVTSHINTRVYPTTIAISDWKKAGLLNPSYVQPVVQTFSYSWSLKKLGCLSPPDSIKLQKFLNEIMGMC